MIQGGGYGTCRVSASSMRNRELGSPSCTGDSDMAHQPPRFPCDTPSGSRISFSPRYQLFQRCCCCLGSHVRLQPSPPYTDSCYRTEPESRDYHRYYHFFGLALALLVRCKASDGQRGCSRVLSCSPLSYPAQHGGYQLFS
jgi:hypothetical protein